MLHLMQLLGEAGDEARKLLDDRTVKEIASLLKRLHKESLDVTERQRRSEIRAEMHGHFNHTG